MTLFQDLRYAVRTAWRDRAFSLIAVTTLALGIGANTALFTIVHAILLAPLPFRTPEQLVRVTADFNRQAVKDAGLSVPELFDLQQSGVFDEIGGVWPISANLTETDEPERVETALVEAGYFTMLGIAAQHGRVFDASDKQPGITEVAVISDALWKRRFGADPGVLGRRIRIDNDMYSIIGVAPAAFRHPGRSTETDVEVWAPAGWAASPFPTQPIRRAYLLQGGLGRLKPGVSVAAAQQKIDALAERLRREFPADYPEGTGWALRVIPLHDDLVGNVRPALLTLLAAVGFVLLIACANVANLLLARGTARSQEIAVRVSLGASRARVVRQLVTESVLISIAGGVLGSVAAVWSFQTLISIAIPALSPPWAPLALSVNVRPDLQVLVFAVALTFGTGLLFGLAPALQITKPDLHAIVKQDTPGTGRGRRGGRLRAALIGVQVALCMVLMIAAGLLLRGLHATYTIDPGFEYRTVALISLESAFDGYSEDESAARRRRLVADLRALPGVEGVASGDHKPLGDDMSPNVIRLPGESERFGRVAEMTTVSHDYFSVLELPIVRGRAFTEIEVANHSVQPAIAPDGAMWRRTRPAIISESTARNLWPGRDPIGQTLLAAPVGLPLAVVTLQVVGVAADAQVSAIGRIDPYYLYVPGEGAALLVKGRGDVATTAADIRTTLRSIDPALVVPVMPLEATLGWSRGISTTVTTLFGSLGVLALVLAAVGVFGVVSFAVSGRYREIAVRLALGASARGVLGLILRQTMRPVVVGALIGVAAASAVSRILTSVLFGVSPVDPVGLGGAALLVLGVAVAAAVMAVRPATRADPIAALRYEQTGFK